MADVASALTNWSTTASSNSPGDSTNVGSGLGDNLRTIQSVVRAYLAHYNSSLTSGASVDLGASTGNIQLVTHAAGTTAITSFGTTSAGIWKVVGFTISGGTLTITHNGTSLILPGAANLTIADGDFLLAFSKGSGNWTVPAIFRADGTSTVFINALTAETSPAVADTIALYDASASANRKMTLENLLKVIDLLTEDATPDVAADFILTYDDSANAVKKALLTNFAASETVKGVVELATIAEVLAGTDTARAVTAAGIAGSKSLANPGHYKLPGGLIINWGSSAYVGTGNFTFDATFPTAVLGYATFHQSSTTGATARVTSINNGGMNIAADGMGGGSSTNGYIVIGY